MDEHNVIKGKRLVPLSFGVLVRELTLLYDNCRFISQLGSSIPWSIDKLVEVKTKFIVKVKGIDELEGSTSLKNYSHNLKLLGEIVNLVHHCYLEPNYITLEL